MSFEFDLVKGRRLAAETSISCLFVAWEYRRMLPPKLKTVYGKREEARLEVWRADKTYVGHEIGGRQTTRHAVNGFTSSYSPLEWDATRGYSGLWERSEGGYLWLIADKDNREAFFEHIRFLSVPPRVVTSFEKFCSAFPGKGVFFSAKDKDFTEAAFGFYLIV